MNAYGLVISCEHGGNRIPEAYQLLFQDYQQLLDSHRGFDPGALLMAENLATACLAPLVAADISRLLVDLNRSIGNPTLHCQLIQKLPLAQREQILKLFYQPYRTHAEQAVRQVLADREQVLHISSHSFTPVLNDRLRHADIGLLYDPSRAAETTFCAIWQKTLKQSLPELIVRRNYPYQGKGDGLTTWFRRNLPATAYVGIELEINQKHIFNTDQHWTALRTAIVETLTRVLAENSSILDPKLNGLLPGTQP